MSGITIISHSVVLLVGAFSFVFAPVMIGLFAVNHFSSRNPLTDVFIVVTTLLFALSWFYFLYVVSINYVNEHPNSLFKTFLLDREAGLVNFTAQQETIIFGTLMIVVSLLSIGIVKVAAQTTPLLANKVILEWVRWSSIGVVSLSGVLLVLILALVAAANFK